MSVITDIVITGETATNVVLDNGTDVVLGGVTTTDLVVTGDTITNIVTLEPVTGIVPGETITDVTTTTEVIDVIGTTQAGPQGPPGPAGASSLDVIAAVDLSGHRVVTPGPNGTVDYATNAEPADATRALWLTLAAATAGDLVAVQPYGEVTEPSWTWTPGGPIYLGIDGHLTQTIPTAPSFLLQVATATTATSLFFDPKVPITLS